MTESKTIDLKPFVDLVGEDILKLAFEKAPTKVATRIAKAGDHYGRALALKRIDEEMGAIRLIAAEEELVVAIFEWLKIDAKVMPAHQDFVSKYKNHLVKLAFYPVLSQFAWIVAELLHDGIEMAGLEEVRWGLEAILHGDRVVLRILNPAGEAVLDHNPLDSSITLEGGDETQAIASLMETFRDRVRQQRGLTLKEFITQRADFRNRLLYAQDGGTTSMEEDLDFLVREVFSKTLRDLLWCLTILLTNKPAKPEWGIVSQFISLFRMALTEAKVLRAGGSETQEQDEVSGS